MVLGKPIDQNGKKGEYCVKTGVGTILGNLNEETYIVSELMERQVMLQDDFFNRRCVKKVVD